MDELSVLCGCLFGEWHKCNLMRLALEIVDFLIWFSLCFLSFYQARFVRPSSQTLAVPHGMHQKSQVELAHEH